MPRSLPYITAPGDELLSLSADLPRDTLRPVARFFVTIARSIDDQAAGWEDYEDGRRRAESV